MNAAGTSERQRSQRVAVAAAITLLADLATKIWALAALDDESIDVVWKLRFHLVSNTGFAFSTGEGLGPLLGIVAAVMAVALWRFRRNLHGVVSTIAVGLVIGGAIGNLVDRVFRGPGWGRGGVVDFIDFQFWPVFNVADAAIVVGVGFLIWHFWREDRRSHAVPADA